MNGRVVAVLVKPGEQVAAGQPVMTLEAMKMEHVHTAGVAGTVSAIDCRRGRAGDDGEDRRGDCGGVIQWASLRGASDEAIRPFSAFGHGLLRFARNDGK